MQDKVDYWLDLCNDDLITAKALLDAKRPLHMGFFCHLIAEKALKAVIASITDDVPPRTHDLRKLAMLGNLLDDLSAEQRTLMEKLLPLHIEARYPEYKIKMLETLTTDYCKQILSETEAFLCWIKRRLEK